MYLWPHRHKIFDHIYTDINNKSKVKVINQKNSYSDNVWIGANTTILRGVEIGNGAIIAAGA